MSWLRPCRFASLVVFAIGLTFASPAFSTVLPVSPGAADRVVETTSACPAFSWSGVDGAIAYELVVLDVGDAENPVLVYSRRIEGAAFAWAPSREECLAPGGVYAWLVRADVEGSGLGDWSAPRRFRVPGAPSAEELSAALAVLERWQATQPAAADPASASAAASAIGKSPSAGGNPATVDTEAPLATGVAAIRGEIPDITGSAFGVFGITHSAAGAGVVARNEAVGPDLVLDGAAQGEADTVLTQSGLDRPSASGATFNFQNSGAGALTLQVDGVAVDTATTPIPWSRLASVPAGFADGVDNDTLYWASGKLYTVGTTFYLFEGHGLGPDADSVDGIQGADLQARVSALCPAGQPLRGINADGSVVCDEVVPIAPMFNIVDDPTNSVGDAVSITLGTDGFPVMSYGDSTASALKVAKCNDAKCNSVVTATVDAAPTYPILYTSIATGADGFPVISYNDGALDDLKVAKCNDAACAPGGETITLVDSTGAVGEYNSLAIGLDGFPVISYFDETAGDLKVVKCNDPACAPGGESMNYLDSVGVVGRHTSIAIGADGLPVISYYDSTSKALKVAKCHNGACSSSSTAMVHDSANTVGLYTSLAIGADGFPVIAYQDNTLTALNVAKCNDLACAGGDETLSTVDSSLFEGESVSLAIGTDDYPVMSYVEGNVDTGEWHLKVAKCDDPACAGGNETLTVVDPAHGTGNPSALVLGADGFPVISYNESFAAALKVVKCNNASCRW